MAMRMEHLSGGSIILPRGVSCVRGKVTEEKIIAKVEDRYLAKFREYYVDYLKMNLHVKLRERILLYKRRRAKPFGFPDDVVTITVDTKNPVALGSAHDEVQDEFRAYTCVTYFGLAVEIRNRNQATVERYYFDVVTEWKARKALSQILLM